MRIKIKLVKCEGAEDVEMPIVKTQESACADLKANFYKKEITYFDSWNECRTVKVSNQFILHPGDRAMIPTGWRFLIPHGSQVKIVPRSGMSLKHGITLINTPGTIDSDYTDEVMVLLHNVSDMPYVVKNGDSIAQMELRENTMKKVFFKITNERDIEKHKETSDREGGFGHTGR